jgi:hypothetical protein
MSRRGDSTTVSSTRAESILGSPLTGPTNSSRSRASTQGQSQSQPQSQSQSSTSQSLDSRACNLRSRNSSRNVGGRSAVLATEHLLTRARAEDAVAANSITTADVSMLHRLHAAILDYPGRKGRADLSATDAGTLPSEPSALAVVGKGASADAAVVRVALHQVHGLMLQYVEEHAQHAADRVVVLPGQLPNPACLLQWGDWREALQTARRSVHAKVMLPALPTGMMAIAESLVLRNLGSVSRGAPSEGDTMAALNRTCRLGADGMRKAMAQRVMRGQTACTVLHGQIAFENDVNMLHDDPLLPCCLASTLGRFLGGRCFVRVDSVQRHPSNAFALFRATISSDAEVRPADVLFRPVHMVAAGLGATAWFVRGDEPRRPPSRATPPRATPPRATPPRATPPRATPPRATPDEDAPAGPLTMAVLTEQLQDATRRGGRVGMSVDALLRSALHVLADEVRSIGLDADAAMVARVRS